MTKEELEKEVEKYINNKQKPLTKYDLIAFAEPRDKRIAELEKRCANYEMNISKMEKGTCDICKETEKDKKILELEKENAELKHIIATLRQEKDNVSMHAKAMEVVAKTRSDQLIKAKEIIKKLYAVYYDPCVTESDLKYRDELFAEINQFLSEVEQWKK